MHRLSALLLLTPFAASGQVSLDRGDVEFSTNFNPSLVGTATNPWLLTLRDGPALKEYAGMRSGFADPERVVLSAGLSANIEVPDDPRYDFLGAPGDFVWILPEGTSEPDLLTPGVSTESRVGQLGWQGIGVSAQFLVQGIPNSTFVGNAVSLSLASFSGPGDFYLYRLNGFGDPLIAFRTDDGVDASDTRNFNAATHTHFEWAFTAPGDYSIGLRASGTLVSGSLFTQSDVTTFRFHIVPEPSGALLLLTGLIAIGSRRRRNARVTASDGITGIPLAVTTRPGCRRVSSLLPRCCL